MATGDSAYERLRVLAKLGVAPLIGRDTELAFLRANLPGADAAFRTVIAVSGEPGAGKTRIITELAHEYVSAGAMLVWLQCYEQSRAVPYAPFLDSTPALPEMVATLTNIQQRPDGDPIEPAQLDLYQRIDATLVRFAEQQRLVIAIDDLQWADGASLDLIRTLARRGRGRESERVMLLTIRADERSADSPPGLLLAELLHDHLLLDLNLSPLSRAATDEFLGELLGVVDQRLAAMVYKRSGGLPYFIEEIVRTLVAEESVIHDGGSWRLVNQAGAKSIPIGVAALVLRRLARLPEETRTALQMAAVIGEHFELTLLAQALRRVPSAIYEALQPALNARILRASENASTYPSPRFGFLHSLTRETIYAHVPRADRRTMHGLLAHAPHLASSAAIVAYHAERANDWALAYAASLRAGDEARRTLAGHEALTHLRRAQALASVGEVSVAAGERLALDQQIVETLVGLGQMAEGARDASLLAQQARDRGEPAVECWAHIQRGAALTFAHELDEAQRSLEHACAQARTLGENALLANALSHLTVLLVKRGYLDEAEQCMLEALPLAETLGDPTVTLSGLDYLGYLATWRGHFETAIRHFEQARAIADEAHDALSLASARFGMALAQTGCARYEDALENLRELQRFSASAGEPYYAARVPNTFGWVYRELGLVDEALTWDMQAVRETEVGDWPGLYEAQANSLLNLGSDLIELHRLAEAEEALEQAAAATERDEFMRWRNRNRLALCQGELALARGDHDRALQYALSAATEGEARRSLKYVSLARDLAGRALGALGKSAEARSAFEEATSIAREIGYTAGRWRTLARLARLLASMGATKEAQARQAEARAVIDEVAGNLRSPELRRRFLMSSAVQSALDPANAGSAPPKNVNYSARADGLSAREIEVLALLARGMTNREISRALVISERTVNSHLAHIFNKLGVSSRAAAAAYALRNDLAE